MITSRRIRCALLLGLVLLPTASFGKTYRVDRDHTSVTFTVRHLFSRVTGRFDMFDGKITFDAAKPMATAVEGTIDVASINTNVQKRDEHLRSRDFFDVEKFPQIRFASTGVVSVDASGKSGKLNGKLSIRGVERPVVLDVEFLGEGKDPWGNVRAGFTARTTIDRKDFGLNWNETLETGGVLVGDEISIVIEAEAMPAE